MDKIPARQAHKDAIHTTFLSFIQLENPSLTYIEGVSERLDAILDDIGIPRLPNKGSSKSSQEPVNDLNHLKSRVIRSLRQLPTLLSDEKISDRRLRIVRRKVVEILGVQHFRSFIESQKNIEQLDTVREERSHDRLFARTPIRDDIDRLVDRDYNYA